MVWIMTNETFEKMFSEALQKWKDTKILPSGKSWTPTEEEVLVFISSGDTK